MTAALLSNSLDSVADLSLEAGHDKRVTCFKLANSRHHSTFARGSLLPHENELCIAQRRKI